jgi:hypothetical protein
VPQPLEDLCGEFISALFILFRDRLTLWVGFGSLKRISMPLVKRDDFPYATVIVSHPFTNFAWMQSKYLENFLIKQEMMS